MTRGYRKLFQRVWNDLRKGENVDLYTTVIIAFILVALNVTGLAPETLVPHLYWLYLALLL